MRGRWAACPTGDGGRGRRPGLARRPARRRGASRSAFRLEMPGGENGQEGAALDMRPARRADNDGKRVNGRDAEPLVAHLAPQVEGEVGGDDDDPEDVEEVPLGRPDDDLR